MMWNPPGSLTRQTFFLFFFPPGSSFINKRDASAYGVFSSTFKILQETSFPFFNFIKEGSSFETDADIDSPDS